MSQTEGKGMPRIEVLISALFFLIFTIWAISRCSSTRRVYQQKEERRRFLQMEEDSIKQMLAEKRRQDSIARLPITIPSGNGSSSSKALSRLYVVVNGLKVRRSPSLDAEVISQLKLFDELYFMDEVTDFTQEINMGKAVANEPWVKVQTREGRSGWVYGAGVNYYKRKNPAAE